MKIVLNEIPEADFKNLNYPFLFANKLSNRVFCLISFGGHNFKFAWQSEISKPIIAEISADIYSVGIDLNFVIADFNNGNAILQLSLDYYFYDTLINRGFIYLVTQLEIIKINQTTFEIIDRYGLPDFFEEIIFKEGLVEVKCLGGEVMMLE